MDFKWTFVRFFKRLKENIYKLGEEFFDDFYEILKLVFKYFPRDCFRFVVRVIQYSSILYNDTDYDYSSILKMLQYKIKRTRLHIGKHDLIKNAKKYCKQMEEVEQLIEAALEDEFCKKEHEEHDKKWGPLDIKSIKISNEPFYQMRFLRAHAYSTQEQEQERKEHRKIIDLEILRKKNNWKKIWNRLEKNIMFWWD
jgi:hypothetical protein